MELDEMGGVTGNMTHKAGNVIHTARRPQFHTYSRDEIHNNNEWPTDSAGHTSARLVDFLFRQNNDYTRWLLMNLFSDLARKCILCANVEVCCCAKTKLYLQ